MSNFSTLGLPEAVLSAVNDLGYVDPTPIQAKVIPHLISGNADLVGLAQTGTGKTAAFGLPLISLTDPSNNSTQALVLTPTRELCLQVCNELQLYAKYLKGIKIQAVYGGADIVRQIKDVKKGAHIIVATPGRLRDLIRRKAADISKVAYMVLDEADEMLNMGFKEEIDDILTNTPDDKNLWLFSATMPAEVRRIAQDYMTSPLELTVGQLNSGNVDISHKYTVVRPQMKYDTLRRFLDVDPDMFALIFTRTRNDAKDLAADLSKDGYNADALHGDLSQSQRDYVMERYRSRRLQILVATDVAARGIDVQEITHVFHYNIPDDPSFYTHRSGRTGRAGSKGISIMLVHPKDVHLIKTLERRLKIEINSIRIPDGQEICKKRIIHETKKIRSLTFPQELSPIISVMEEALAELTREELIQKIASLALDQRYHHYFHAPDLNEKKGQPASSAKTAVGKMSTLFINLGSVDVEGKGEFLKIVTQTGSIKAGMIGKIRLQSKHSFFEVPQDMVESVINSFKGVEFDGRSLRVNLDDKPKEERQRSGIKRSKPKRVGV